MDELTRAYATLGVSFGAPLDEVRKRYKALVRQWHPDRFARDTQGQAEAGQRLRAINDAFRTVAAVQTVHGAAEPPGGPEVPRSSPFSGRRLTREEIDRMVEAMRNDGPLDWLIRDPWYLRVEETGPRLAAAAIGAFSSCIVVLSIAESSGASEPTLGWLVIVSFAAAFAALLRFLPRKQA
jgi:hypothetical protein